MEESLSLRACCDCVWIVMVGDVGYQVLVVRSGDRSIAFFDRYVEIVS